MTIKELMEKLKLYDENTEVRYDQAESDFEYQSEIDIIRLEMSDRPDESKEILLLI